MVSFTFDGQKVDVQILTYGDSGNTCIRLVESGTNKAVAVPTKASKTKLPPEQVLIKDPRYVQALENHQIIKSSKAQIDGCFICTILI